MNHWLMKSEPDVFSIDQLAKDKTTWWEGVRNYQARNYMMNDMKVGDLVLFYHSNAEPSGVAGIAKVSKVAEPDKLQFDKKSEYFDEKATKDKPRWFCVEVQFVSKFKHIVSLQDLRENPKLADMMVLAKGSRLSVQPVEKKHFDIVSKLGG
ncbi:EVE domain-containing protein [Bdellovibrio reynosensis]|uniref:EVE domain-containing protein n=1 Tax=Bdellovibrio reynosensis TaxID=2835041 RepID=A0ABY4CFZ7_9BACT|nr:EVE domain-containing protein [Bdellovibrio reynosensis]UOF02596.1 EVE domain-containing protein [Bdellovibrio reynosensis]